MRFLFRHPTPSFEETQHPPAPLMTALLDSMMQLGAFRPSDITAQDFDFKKKSTKKKDKKGKDEKKERKEKDTDGASDDEDSSSAGAQAVFGP